MRLERKLAAVLAYLALHGPTTRERLGELLWPDVPRDRARNSVRQAVHRLRQLSGAALVEGERNEAVLSPGLTVDLGPGPSPERLLDGCDFGDCPDFDAWLEGQRRRWAAARRQRVVAELDRLEADGALQAALARVEVELAHAPDDEGWYQRGMRLYFLLGNRRAGLGLYARCAKVLREVLGAEPSDETRALAAHLERGAPGALPASVRRWIAPGSVCRSRCCGLRCSPAARASGPSSSAPGRRGSSSTSRERRASARAGSRRTSPPAAARCGSSRRARAIATCPTRARRASSARSSPSGPRCATPSRPASARPSGGFSPSSPSRAGLIRRSTTRASGSPSSTPSPTSRSGSTPASRPPSSTTCSSSTRRAASSGSTSCPAAFRSAGRASSRGSSTATGSASCPRSRPGCATSRSTRGWRW